MDTFLFDSLSAYTTFFAIASLILLFYELGYQIAIRRYLKKNIKEPSTLGQISGGLLGMWAFVLAFTFSIVATQFRLRKDLVMEEANAVGTAFLRADLINPEDGLAIKKDLARYIDIRLQVLKSLNVKDAIVQSVEIHRSLWARITSVAVANPNTNTSLLTQAINEVIDIHEKRVTAGTRTRIPHSIWVTLFIISFLAILSIGMQAGFNKSRRLLMIIPLIMAFAALSTLIVDLNNPQSGSIKVDQQPMQSLQKSIQEEGF